MASLPDLERVRLRLEQDEVLNSASAISFQVLTAIIPLVLFGLALAGFANLEGVWEDAADTLRPKLSRAAFTVVDDTVRAVLTERQPLWLTIGLALTLWRISSAMRAVMSALDKIYDDGRERSLKGRLFISVALAAAVTALFLAAVAIVHLGGHLVPVEGTALRALSAIVRWGLAGILLLVAVGLVLHHAPTQPQSLGWVSFGSLVCVGCWLIASIAFGVYVTDIASYGSLFGSFASIFLLLTYLYLSATAFLLGVLLDAEVRDDSQDSRA